MEKAGAVKELFIYPIKACRGISVPYASVSSTGFRWDRQWLIVNSKYRAYTQRVEPKLALVEVSLPTVAFTEDWKPTTASFLNILHYLSLPEPGETELALQVHSNNIFQKIGSHVERKLIFIYAFVVNAPGMNPLKVPLLQKSHRKLHDVSVWEWSGSAIDEGDEAAKWFSQYLEKPARLVRFDVDSETRTTEAEYARGFKIMFSDKYPFLLISKASLDALNKHLKEPLPINRFRPNIFVEGCEPFAEDIWRTLKINDMTFHGVKLCSRCKVPSINQETGVAGNEPSEALSKFRSGNTLFSGKKARSKVFFGQNLVCDESLSPQPGRERIVHVGDPVYVVRKISSTADAAA